MTNLAIAERLHANNETKKKKKRPDMEWNDLLEDMVTSSKASSWSDLLEPPSGASSRSGSTGRKKKTRAYAAAAFEN